MHARWSALDLPPQLGRVAVVTGGTGGIGHAVARGLARAGATVVLGVRDEARGAAAANDIRAAGPGPTVIVAHLDLASLSSIREFATRLHGEIEGPDVLVNCAGVMAVPHQVTADGFEMQFGVNHLGHFALTGLLIGRMLARPGARVVTVSSINHRAGRIDFDDLQGQARYRAWKAYGQSKLANLLFAFELDRRLRAAGAVVASLGAHPGYSNTRLQSHIGDPLVRRIFLASNRFFAQPAEAGALPVLYAATAPGVTGGAYAGPDRFFELRGAPGPAKASAASHDPLLARRLWEVSEGLTGVVYPSLAVVGA
jgi:NAD(P)-dependent dehydrogenase (short-subunit alcohol dehydrogenase family)